MNQCPPGPQVLEPFWIFSKIRGDIRELLFITGVNNTSDKLFSSVNDTGEKVIAVVIDTGDYSLSRIFSDHRCCWYGEQFITGVNDTNNFVAGDNTTGDNFVAGVNDTGEQL